MKEALKLALDVLNESWHLTPKPDYVRVAITAIEAALAASWGYRICEFCGCHTNAKARACCDAGRDADKALAQECPNLKNCKGACFQCEYFNVDTGMLEYPAAQPAPLPYMHSQWQEMIAGIPVTFESEADAKRFLTTLKAKLKELNT